MLSFVCKNSKSERQLYPLGEPIPEDNEHVVDVPRQGTRLSSLLEFNEQKLIF